MRFILIALLAAVAGCGTSTWVRPGATQQDFIADRYACERDVSRSTDKAMVGMLFTDCLEAKGWRSVRR